MDKEKIMKLCQQIGLIAMSNKKHYPALHSDFDFINDAQMDIFREVTAPPKTNAERIRQMTDEELAKFMCLVKDKLCFGCSFSHVDECESISCEEARTQWLKQEVSEDADR